MRIVIEHDTTATVTSGAPGVAAPGEAENAGGAPEASTADSAGGEDGGGPPQWLLDAVGRAMEADQMAPGTTVDAADAGAAPQQD